jgi:hypothetical protein
MGESKVNLNTFFNCSVFWQQWGFNKLCDRPSKNRPTGSINPVTVEIPLTCFGQKRATVVPQRMQLCHFPLGGVG